MSGRVAHKPEISSSLAGAEDIGTLIVRHPFFYGLAGNNARNGRSYHRERELLVEALDLNGLRFDRLNANGLNQCFLKLIGRLRCIADLVQCCRQRATYELRKH